MTNKKRLLLIDDDDDDRFFFYSAVKATGFPIELLHEPDCDLAIKKLSDGNLSVPELLFLDWYMPKMDGRDCLKKIRNITTCSKVPIILLTGSESPEIWETANEFDVSFVLYKSWDQRVLTKELGKVFSKYELEK
jgi:DNA-binding response OmpR family regulator